MVSDRRAEGTSGRVAWTCLLAFGERASDAAGAAARLGATGRLPAAAWAPGRVAASPGPPVGLPRTPPDPGRLPRVRHLRVTGAARGPERTSLCTGKTPLCLRGSPQPRQAAAQRPKPRSPRRPERLGLRAKGSDLAGAGSSLSLGAMLHTADRALDCPRHITRRTTGREREHLLGLCDDDPPVADVPLYRYRNRLGRASPRAARLAGLIQDDHDLARVFFVGLNPDLRTAAPDPVHAHDGGPGAELYSAQGERIAPRFVGQRLSLSATCAQAERQHGDRRERGGTQRATRRSGGATPPRLDPTRS